MFLSVGQVRKKAIARKLASLGLNSGLEWEALLDYIDSQASPQPKFKVRIHALCMTENTQPKNLH